MNDLLVKFRDILDMKMNKFFDQAAKQFSIDKEKLILLWNEQTVNEEKGGLGRTKKSFYQIFFSIKRIELKEKDPGLNFGELSKQISKLWNSMSKQEQNEWIKKNHLIVDESENCYKNMKISDLRSLCHEKGVNSKGNKIELIQALTSKKKIAVQEDDSIHISDSANNQKRTEIEIQNNDDQDEEDFIFEDDEESTTEQDDEDDDEDDNDFEGDEEI